MKRRGASRVLGIDTDEHYLRQARFAAEMDDVDVEFLRMPMWDVAALGEKFDLVIFMGVLYHLRHPLLGCSKTKWTGGHRGGHGYLFL